MEDYFDSTTRGPVDYVLFGMGFIGVILGAAGVIVESVAAAVAGFALLLLVVCAFRLMKD